MTIGEIYRWIDRTPGQPHAIGRYQFIPSTLRSLVRQAGLSNNDRFTSAVQDGLADILLVDAGFNAFKKGKISRHRFMENLARIWAGFPTSNGRSYYHGYAGNKAVISWNEFDAVMKKIFATKRG
jgi:muramidase (phage lysozyme)